MSTLSQMPAVQPGEPVRLSDSQLQEFIEHGFVLVQGIFGADEMERINEHLLEGRAYAERNEGVAPWGWRFQRPLYKPEAHLAEGHLESITGDLDKDPVFHGMARDPRILDLAEQIIGPNIKLYTSQYAGKPAFVGTPHAWHQDPSYWQSHGPAYFSFWVSVDGSNLENGCVEFLPGTHKLGLLKTVPRPLHKEEFMRKNYQETSPPWTVPTVEGASDAPLDFSKRIPAILPAGSASIHNSLTVHTSAVNSSPYRRGAVILTYIQADLPRRDGKPCGLPVVRGRAGLIPKP